MFYPDELGRVDPNAWYVWGPLLLIEAVIPLLFFFGVRRGWW